MEDRRNTWKIKYFIFRILYVLELCILDSQLRILLNKLNVLELYEGSSSITFYFHIKKDIILYYSAVFDKVYIYDNTPTK